MCGAERPEVVPVVPALALLSGVRGGALRKHYHGAIASYEERTNRRKNKHLNLADLLQNHYPGAIASFEAITNRRRIKTQKADRPTSEDESILPNLPGRYSERTQSRNYRAPWPRRYSPHKLKTLLNSRAMACVEAIFQIAGGSKEM